VKDGGGADVAIVAFDGGGLTTLLVVGAGCKRLVVELLLILVVVVVTGGSVPWLVSADRKIVPVVGTKVPDVKGMTVVQDPEASQHSGELPALLHVFPAEHG